MARHSGNRIVIGEVRESSSAGFIGERIVPAGGVHWERHSHREMWDMIMRSRPAELFARADRWRDAATRLEDASKVLQQKLNTLLATWQGPAAEAAAASQQRLLNWAQDAAVRASAVGTQLANYGNALVSARQRMPQPQHRWAEQSFRDGDGANALDGVAGAHLLLQMMTNRLPTAQEAREAKREAVEIMRELEGNAVEAERAMPRFTDAPQTTNEGAPSQVPWQQPSPVSPSPTNQPPSYQFFDGASVGTTSAQFAGDPSGYATGDSRGSLPYGGGAAAGGGAAGGGAAGGQPGVAGKGPAAPFGRGPGMGAGPLGVLGQGGPAAGRPGAAGHGSGFLPGTAGGRGQGDEDTEKPLADYIEPDDIFKDDRPAWPSVFGA